MCEFSTPRSPDTHCLELVLTPQLKGSVSQDCLSASVQMPVTSSRCPGHPQFLSDVAMNQIFHDHLLGLDHLLKQLTEARVTLTYVYYLLADKKYNKGYR